MFDYVKSMGYKDAQIKRIPYSSKVQKRILERVINFAERNFSGKPLELLTVYGSLVKGEFGKYDKKNRWGELYSDVDLGIITAKRFRIPKGWIKTKTYLSCDSYAYKNKIFGKHPIRLKVFVRDGHNPRDKINLRLPINRKVDGKKEIVILRAKKL